VLVMGNCCYVAVCSAAQGASVPMGLGEGRGHIMAAAHLQLECLEFLMSEIYSCTGTIMGILLQFAVGMENEK